MAHSFHPFAACLLLPLLAGCVAFERAPAALTCDPQLQGRWLPLPNTPAETAELTADDYALVDAQCRATVSMSKIADKAASVIEIDVPGFKLGGERYLALDEDDVGKLFASGPMPTKASALPGSAVVLVRYRIEGDTLSLATIDFDTVKKKVDGRRLAATPLDEFSYLIPGSERDLQKLLRAHPDLFQQDDGPPMKMRRAQEVSLP